MRSSMTGSSVWNLHRIPSISMASCIRFVCQIHGKETTLICSFYFCAVPYGVYDITTNEGWVSVGISHDTAQFAVASILKWWREMGTCRFPQAAELLITADGGGSNGHRTRLWKVELQGLADETGLKLHVRHFPPGTSKWNK